MASPGSNDSEYIEESRSEDSAGNESGRTPKQPPDEAVSHRMVYEDDLRKACGKRALEISEQHIWVAFRSKIPISRWVERTFDSQKGKTKKKKLLKELEDYQQIFFDEAEERHLELDMERNYYSEAVELFGGHHQADTLSEEQRECLRDLMIMVDYKDAKLGIQIVKSIL